MAEERLREVVKSFVGNNPSNLTDSEMRHYLIMAHPKNRVLIANLFDEYKKRRECFTKRAHKLLDTGRAETASGTRIRSRRKFFQGVRKNNVVPR